MPLCLLLGGHGNVVGGHGVDKAFSVGLGEGGPGLDLKVGKGIVGGQNHGYSGCFALLPALAMVTMKLRLGTHFLQFFKLMNTLPIIALAKWLVQEI